ncbi:MAG: molybdopterin converting factor subunit 1 [Deltaproteobacteria bacterium]|nr:molybdopterin converting factor subunit 1 [Deltaproteobacteria bacterium]
MRIEVLFFAAARERAGTERDGFELGEHPTVNELAQAIASRHLALAPLLPRLRFAVNRAFVPTSHELQEGDEVALIPPVAGGSGRFAVLPKTLDPGAVAALVAGPEQGGIVTFLGAVRDHSHGKKVQRLEYEAFGPMALSQLELIAREAEERWPGVRLAIHHRVGVLQVGEVAVVIAAAAPHRKEAFLACEHALERLKQDVPIWKKEVYEDGAQWVGLGP